MTKAILLDRDGTINVDEGYTHKIENLEFEQGAIKGLKTLQDLGYKLIIITSQSGIGRGKYTEEQYQTFMQEMYKRLGVEGIKIETDYFCPHHPEKAIGKYKKDCNCRKPKTGMLEQSVKDFNLEISRCWAIGDKMSDIEMGQRGGCRTVLVLTAKAGKEEKANPDIKPDYTAQNLEEAANYIKNESQN
ncbi:MAG: D,D-heptose 1,7-bisphosphate phosphatase [Nanoarchaeota archaeon]|jgi:D,D-heptose 1,7-bisphosphate phosphatase|nr:D,D-heptose 1,7-bisphosphate phosphatase [Nanoarchaeota archaeon]|tara:strand:+ start:834 stop:1400 length:567 start_codon:yes stop_codon:yes gene_type:complete